MEVEHMPAPCPVREDDLSSPKVEEAFMLPCLIKGYRPVFPAPLGTTRDS